LTHDCLEAVWAASDGLRPQLLCSTFGGTDLDMKQLGPLLVAGPTLKAGMHDHAHHYDQFPKISSFLG